MPARLLLSLLLLVVVTAACSGDDDPADDGAEATAAATDAAADTDDAATTAEPDDTGTGEPTAAEPTDAAAEPTTDAAAAQAGELPQFASDFDRVCTTGVGFGGAAPYEQVSGTHPVILFEEQDSGVLIESGVTLPAGWAVEEDGNFDDNSELAATELIACATITARTPNGTSCDLEGEGETITLALVDTTWDLSVHAATTGQEVGQTTIEAATTTCPTFVFVEEGQTEYLNTPTEDQYISALQPFVFP